MKNLFFLLLGLAMLCTKNTAIAQHENAQEEHQSVFAHFESNSPIGLSGDHFHTKGSWMLSYKFMPMRMSGNLSGTDAISTDKVHQSFMIAPVDMQMNMHMIGVMYAPTNRFTIMAMSNFLQNTMNLEMRNGVQFSTASRGLSDVSLSALYAFVAQEKQSFHGLLRLSIPTGNIDQRDQTPMSENALLAYPMQLGSGTWDATAGGTYLLNTENFCYGLQTQYKYRFDENVRAYTLGNSFRTNIWTAYRLNKFWSFSARAEYLDIGNIKGTDSDWNPMMMPLFDVNNSGKTQVNLSGGFNLKFPTVQLDGLQMGIEVGYPVYQNVEGIQMKKELFGTLGLKYTLGGTHSTCH